VEIRGCQPPTKAHRNWALGCLSCPSSLCQLTISKKEVRQHLDLEEASRGESIKPGEGIWYTSWWRNNHRGQKATPKAVSSAVHNSLLLDMDKDWLQLLELLFLIHFSDRLAYI